MAEKKVVLLGSWASPFAHRVQIVLAEKGVEYEYIEQDLFAGKSEILLKANPVYKKVPVLLHNGKPVCESLNIVRYIEEVWPEKAPVLPADPYARAQALFWADFIDKKIYECGTRLCKLKGEKQEEARKEFVGIMNLLEKELGEKKFFGGEAFGFVDVALVPFFARFYAYETCANFSTERECPKIVAWAKRCMEKDSVAKTLPEPKKVYGHILALKKKLGIN